jgi:NADPH-dependent 2,4-dienoyl-CoA reductase/sulfur reductase-like enzyme
MSQLQRAVSIVALCCGIILPHIVRPESPSVRDQVRQSVLTADVVVYTASPGGVAAAIAAAREGASVILVEPDPYIGGIIAQGGLCISDVGKTETIGGLARNFFDRVAAYYADKYGEKSVQLRETVIRGLKGAAFEPKGI